MRQNNALQERNVTLAPTQELIDEIRRGRMIVLADAEDRENEGDLVLAELAGLTPAAVICEIMNADGSMARLPDLVEFAARHGLKLGTIADLIRHRSMHEKLIERVADKAVTTPYGPFRLCVYHDKTA